MDSLILDKEELIHAMESNLANLKKTLPKPVRSEMIELYEHKSKALISLIESNYFLQDEELNHLINEIFKEITTKNPREGYPERLLISRSPSVNAQCWGEGTMVIHLGLLGRIKTSGELAFVMAHEISHQLLDHLNLRIKGALERWNDKDLKKRVEESGKLAVLKELTYEGSRYSRKYERQADSLAVVLLKNTKYNWWQYEQVLNMLDSADYPEYRKSPDIRSFFNFSRYPFQDKWLIQPQSAFGKAESNSFIYDRDSIQSHPDIESRIRYLEVLFGKVEAPILPSERVLSAELQQRIDFEITQGAFVMENYGLAMFYTLQMLERYPENKYLKSLLAKIWYELYVARKEHVFSRYVTVSNKYPLLMESLHIFLNNLRLSEIAFITFNYLNRDAVFDKDNEEHYLILWQISDELKLTDVQEKLLLAYHERFPDGTKLNSAK